MSGVASSRKRGSPGTKLSPSSPIRCESLSLQHRSPSAGRRAASSSSIPSSVSPSSLIFCSRASRRDVADTETTTYLLLDAASTSCCGLGYFTQYSHFLALVNPLRYNLPRMPKPYNQACPIAQALDIVGDRWALLIVRDLFLGQRRFSELLASLPGIPPRLLSGRLKRLEQRGLIERVIYSEYPLRAEYRLTGEGLTLPPVLPPPPPPGPPPRPGSRRPARPAPAGYNIPRYRHVCH